jgi:arylformamidase
MVFHGKRVIDITPVISGEIAVFPGDTSFKREELLSFKNGNNLVLSTINTTVHLGAHTDAPSHYHPDGKTMDQCDLGPYMGECQVIEISKKVSRIAPEDFNVEVTASRVLFKTGSFPDPNNWNDDFSALDPKLVSFLAGKGVQLIGIDTPSVDPADDRELLTHNEIYKNKIAILEGIVLDDVKEGIYELLALPLPIKGGDASPVRAILLEG